MVMPIRGTPGIREEGNVTVTIIAGKRLNHAGAVQLHASLLAQIGNDIRIDAGNVEALGTAGLQLLLAAQKAWRDEGHAFSVQPQSDIFVSSLGIAGVAADLFIEGDLQ